MSKAQLLAEFVPNGSAGPYLEVVKAPIDFGTLKLGQHETIKFEIDNKTTVPVQVEVGFYTTGIYSNYPGSELTGYGFDKLVTIAPGGTYNFSLRFDAQHFGALMTPGGANDFLTISPKPNTYVLDAIEGNVVGHHAAS